MDISKIAATLTAEQAAAKQFNALSADERKAYLKAFPASAFLDHLKKGALHRDLGIPEDEEIPLSEEKKLAKTGTPHEKKMANFAINQRKWHKHHSAVAVPQRNPEQSSWEDNPEDSDEHAHVMADTHAVFKKHGLVPAGSGHGKDTTAPVHTFVAQNAAKQRAIHHALKGLGYDYSHEPGHMHEYHHPTGHGVETNGIYYHHYEPGPEGSQL